MRQNIILDTGPLVALIHRNDEYHSWSREEAAEMTRPLLTCEAVTTEAYFLLRGIPDARRSLINMVVDGLVQISFALREEIEPISRLLARYANIPMSFADACLVRMCEQHSSSILFTTDSDFIIYRKHGRQVIPVIMPPLVR